MRATLEALRAAELEDLREHFRAGMRVLEVGGGDGFQARTLAGWGLEVVSLDVPNRPRAAVPYFAVQDYDGQNLPFPDGSFERVFSSNVLEHVKEVAALVREMRRVLRPDGLMIHVLPSSAWRLWTSITYYPHVLGKLLGASAPPLAERTGRNADLRRLVRPLVAGPHGEYPSAFAEIYYFSRPRWRRVFEGANLEVVSARPTSLFYTGYVTSPLGIDARRRLSRVLGAAGTTFVLRRRGP